MIKSVHFIARHEAIAMAGKPDSVLISLYGMDEKAPHLSPDWKGILSLQFDDIKEYRGPAFKLFDKELADKIVSFVVEHRDCEHIYVHCYAGISRSAGVAIALSDYFKVPIFSREIPMSPSYSLYNKLVYKVLSDAFYDATNPESYGFSQEI